MGLGLSIVRDLVQAHHGKVVLKSEPGIGSQFTILLPLSPATDL
jgi:signal transduction histidine kinase